MKKSVLSFLLIIFISVNLYGQISDAENSATVGNTVPVHFVFHNIGWNLFNSVTYNYGLNFIGAGVGTWGAIESDIDYRWRNFGYDHPDLADAGLVVLPIGFVVPVIVPVTLYAAGRYNQDKKLQIAALALTQSMILTLSIQSPLKMITGRASPGIVNDKRGRRSDNFSRDFDWFNMDFVNGWPSGHTANAFSAAATITEIYKDNLWLKIGAYSYAALIGFGVSVNVHWASEVFAGALMGYAIGKTVGKSFNKLLVNDESENDISFFFTPNAAGVIMRF
jgi:membrane-associated phospholipid phosphatase